MSDSDTPITPGSDASNAQGDHCSWDDVQEDPRLDQHYADVKTIGDFLVVRPLGQGGSSDVFLCEQHLPRRQVALKLLKVSQCDTRRQQRFQLEIDVLATLEHPGIASIYEAGFADVGRGPQPYYTMEAIDGERLDTFLKTDAYKQLSINDRIYLFLKIVDAVAFAHESGVVHRDLKPSNILVTKSSTPQVKVIDFGLARLAEPTTTVKAVTKTGHLVGTPMYMSPEQFRHDGHIADYRSDVYGLGLVLYEMLTEHLPYELKNKTALVEIANIILQETPRPLSKFDSSLKGDLEVVVGKALEKDPAHRYQSLAAMTEDLELFLAGRPIRTKRPTLWGSAVKWYRRQPRVALSVIGTALLLMAITIVATVASIHAYLGQARSDDYAVRLDRTARYLNVANGELTELAEDAQRSSASATLMRTGLSRDSNPSLTRSLLLDEKLIPERHRHFAWKLLERQSDWLYTEGRWKRGPVLAAAFSEDGAAVALCAGDAIDVRSSDDLTMLWSVNERLDHPTVVSLDPSHNRIAYRKRDRAIYVYDSSTKKKQRLFDGEIDASHSVTFSASGKLAVGLSQGVIRVWDDIDQSPKQFQVADAPIVGLRFSVDEGQIYAAAANGLVQTVQLTDGSIVQSAHYEAMGIQTARFSRDGRYVAGGRRFHNVRVWDREGGPEPIYENRNPGPYVACDLESSQLRIGLATRSRVELIRPGNKPVFLRLGNTPVRTLCVAPNGSLMLVGDDGGHVCVFRTRRPEVPRRVPMSGRQAGKVRFASDNKLITFRGPGNIDRYCLDNGEYVDSLPPQPSLIADAELNRSRTMLFYSLTVNRIESWDLAENTPGPLSVKVNQRIVDFVLTPDQSKLYGVSRGGNLWTHDLKTKLSSVYPAQHEHPCTAITHAPNAEVIYTADEQGSIQRWELKKLRTTHSAPSTGARVHELAVSPGGRVIAAACGDGNVRIYDADSLELLKELVVHTSAVRTLDFTPDGVTLATGGLDSQLVLWDTVVWQAQSVWDVDGTGIRSARFSPDGKTLAVCGNHNEITLWETE